jgi:hypothetical protein
LTGSSPGRARSLIVNMVVCFGRVSGNPNKARILAASRFGAAKPHI